MTVAHILLQPSLAFVAKAGRPSPIHRRHNIRMFLAGPPAATPSARTPAISALGISALAHLIPLLLIATLMGRLNSGTDLTRSAAALSWPSTRTPAVGA